MRVYVDENKCKIAGICVKELPDVFQFNRGNKKARVVVNPVPLQLQQDVMEILPKCPTNAISVEFDDVE